MMLFRNHYLEYSYQEDGFDLRLPRSKALSQHFVTQKVNFIGIVDIFKLLLELFPFSIYNLQYYITIGINRSTLVVVLGHFLLENHNIRTYIKHHADPYDGYYYEKCLSTFCQVY